MGTKNKATQKTVTCMEDINPTIFEYQWYKYTKGRFSEWIKKHVYKACKNKDILNKWRKIYHANTNQKKVGITIFILDRLQSKESYSGEREALHNEKGVSSLRRRNNL